MVELTTEQALKQGYWSDWSIARELDGTWTINMPGGITFQRSIVNLSAAMKEMPIRLG